MVALLPHSTPPIPPIASHRPRPSLLSSAQRLLGSVFPLAAMVYLFPSRFHMRALSRQHGGSDENGSASQHTWAPQVRVPVLVDLLN